MPSEQLDIQPTTTLPAKFVPSLASLVRGGKSLAEIMTTLVIDEKEARSRLTAAALLDTVLARSTNGETKKEEPIVEPQAKWMSTDLQTLVGKRFLASKHEVGNGHHVEVKFVDGKIIRLEWTDGPGVGGAFAVTAKDFFEQFDEVPVVPVAAAPATTAEPTFKRRGRKASTTPATPPATPSPGPAAAAAPVAAQKPAEVVPRASFTPAPPHPGFTQEIRVETTVQLPSVELTDVAAMALGRLAAVGMNSNVSVDRILAWARTVIEAQTKTTVHTWVKP